MTTTGGRGGLMEYLDFELRVGPGRDGDYPVSVLRSPAGEAEGVMRLPFDAAALQQQLDGLEAAVRRSSDSARDIVGGGASSAAPGTAAQAAALHAGASLHAAVVPTFGRQLFDALLNGAVRESFRRSQDRARAAGKGLRVRLRIEDPTLATLPWEYLFDPEAGDYVCLSSDTPVVRYLEFERPPEALTIDPPLSILGVVATPSDRPALDVARERQRIDAATQALVASGLVRVTWLDGSTWRDLQHAMRAGPFHVFHFVGHGGFDASAGEGVIALTDDAGRSALLSATQLGRLLADHQSLRLAVLNSCLGARGSGADVFSSTAAMLIRRGVPAVVAMQYEISDRAAVEFGRSLYEALVDGAPVDAAVAEARKAVSFAAGGSVEWGTPVLHMRSPDGVLFRRGGAVPRAEAAGAAAARDGTTGSANGGGQWAGDASIVRLTDVRANGGEPTRADPAGRAPSTPAPVAATANEAAASAPARRQQASAPRRTGRGVALSAVGVAAAAAIGFMVIRRPSGAAAPSAAAPPSDAPAPGPVRALAAPAPPVSTASASAPAGRPRGPLSAGPFVAVPTAAGGAFLGGVGSVDTLTLSHQGIGQWTLRLHVVFSPTTGQRRGTATCTLRPGSPDQLVVSVPVTSTPGVGAASFARPFRIARPWPAGTFPVACTSLRGEQVFAGRVTVH